MFNFYEIDTREKETHGHIVEPTTEPGLICLDICVVRLVQSDNLSVTIMPSRLWWRPADVTFVFVNALNMIHVGALKQLCLFASENWGRTVSRMSSRVGG